MRALIDADLPANELGHLTEEVLDPSGDKIKVPLPWKEVAPLAKGRFISILTGSEAGGHTAYLSRGNTFRHDLATIQPYKGNRDPANRGNWTLRIKDLYHELFGAKWCDGIEADDALAMDAWAEWADLAKQSDYNEEFIKDNATVVICSRDKDLNTIPGWHFNWTLKKEKEKRIATGEVHPERPPYYLSLIEATRNFYKQLLTGDRVDNIHGLYNVGPKSAWIKQLDEMDNEAVMYEHVKDKYEKYYASKWKEWLSETGKLLWLWRRPNDIWRSPSERDSDWYL